jgi:hypothetical protein
MPNGSPAGPGFELAERLERAARLVAEHRDVIVTRPDGDVVPEAWARRGWDAYLLGLDDLALDRAELLGLDAALAASPPAAVPPSLAALIEEAARVTTLPPLASPPPHPGPPSPSPSPGWRRASLRKQEQVRAFVAAVRAHPGLAACTRIVDVGSGHGHLTRQLAAALGVPAVALERSPERVEVARRLSGENATDAAAVTVEHLNVDVLEHAPAFAAGDLAVGLHACGELGDALVQRAAAESLPLVLVGCCAQKRRQPAREPLTAVPGLAPSALELPREALGLANLLPQAEGVERPLADNLEARARRAALHELLLGRGLEVQPGEEMRGLNRRQAHAPLASLAARALALRGLPAPTAAELDTASQRGALRHGRRRRLALPRTVLGRVLEVYLLLDRAAWLEQAGHQVQVGTLFDTDVSPRNLALLGCRPAQGAGGLGSRCTEP